jgi:hypothetical protein
MKLSKFLVKWLLHFFLLALKIESNNFVLESFVSKRYNATPIETLPDSAYFSPVRVSVHTCAAMWYIKCSYVVYKVTVRIYT